MITTTTAHCTAWVMILTITIVSGTTRSTPVVFNIGNSLTFSTVESRQDITWVYASKTHVNGKL